jgi:hypothetical protein
LTKPIARPSPKPWPTCSSACSFWTPRSKPPGCFQLRLDRSAAAAIAADFLGKDIASLTPRQSTEVTLELANMICGAALSQIESGATFRLGTPEILACGLARPGPAEDTWYTVDTGSGALSAAIQMETRTCPAPQKSAS